MLIIFPVSAWFILLLIFAKDGEWRRAFLSSCAIWGLVLTAITELLSLFGRFTLGGLLVSWACVVLVLLFAWLRFRKGKLKLPKLEIPAFLGVLSLSIAVIVAALGLIALIAPPNNWDSMNYHMARVAHWIQNKSIGFYPTMLPSQLYQNPWAEFAIGHLQILSGGDRFANLVQWFSMVGSIVGVTLIAQELKADHRGRVFAAVICATIPVGILMASNTKNDYILAFWLVCFVYYTLRFRREPCLRSALGVGITLGLAILTKATAYLYAFPFLVWFVLSAFGAYRRQMWKPTLLAAAFVVAINLGHWTRNLDLYGSPLGPGGESPEHRYANDVFTAGTLVSNLIRTTAVHLGTPFSQINSTLEEGVEQIHSLLGLDVNDPRTTWGGTEFRIKGLRTHEDASGNLLHIILIATGLGIGLAWKQLGLSRESMQYAGALIVALLLFSLYLKWTPWHGRLHMPLFVLWSPWLAIILRSLPSQKLAGAILVVLILASLPWILFNESRPLVGTNSIFATSRLSEYFANRPGLEAPYTQAAALVSQQGCKNVGLSLRGSSVWEYPLWVLLEKDQDQRVRIDHVDVTNVSGTMLEQVGGLQTEKCAIICVDCPEDKQMAHASEFGSVSKYDSVYVFINQRPGRPDPVSTTTGPNWDLAQTYVAIGNEMLAQGASDQAIGAYRLAAVNWPDWGLAHTKLGNAYRSLGRLDDAEQAYRQSIQVEPSYVGAYLNLGSIYEEQGRAEEALTLYQEAVWAVPDSAWAYRTLGSAYLTRGNGSDALHHLERAVELEPEGIPWLLALAGAYRELGRYEEATATYRRVLTQDPGNANAIEALRALEP
jgi:Flp pilus assembly protein TadD/4-amino-4-deoxy-L-arabinose transferase-like glycosyltransferase